MNNDRFKFRVWDKTVNRYFQDEEFCLNCFGSLVIQSEFDGDSLRDMDDFIIEQCTGIRDKNGKLIYEGDIVVVPNTYPFYDDSELNYIGIIEYDDEGAMFVLVMECVNPKKRGISSGIAEGLSEYEELEIIGNIHDEKWGLE